MLKKIFITLITIVACVIIGALVLNVLLPNTATSLVNSAEDMVFKGTGMSFDFNGDGDTGGTNASNSYTDVDNTDEGGDGAGVEGFN